MNLIPSDHTSVALLALIAQTIEQAETETPTTSIASSPTMHLQSVAPANTVSESSLIQFISPSQVVRFYFQEA